MAQQFGRGRTLPIASRHDSGFLVRQERDSSDDLELGELLGEGGMGRVHAAHQRSLDREVAVKSLHASDADARAELHREALIMSGLEHPGIVPVHALDSDATGKPILVMRRIGGVQWTDLIHDPDEVAWRTRPGDRVLTHLEIMTKLCDVLQFAHQKGIIHRDIKPDNVLLGECGETYLVDWGLARRIGATSSDDDSAGTPAYMAPEMALGRRQDERTDVYLLGATLHEALTGEQRNTGASIPEVLISAAEPTPWIYDDRVPVELAEICNRATERDPDARFQTMSAFKQALSTYLRHRGALALAAAARARTRELAELLDAHPSLGGVELRRAVRLGNECRFAYVEALREWPDNEAAQRGSVECMSLLVKLELRQGHLDVASELLREMGTPPAELVETVFLLQLEADERAREEARVRSIAFDVDPAVSASSRTRFLALKSGAYVLGTCLLVAFVDLSRATPRLFFFLGIVFLAINVALVAAYRRALVLNHFNRSLSIILVTLSLTVVANRALALHLGTSLVTMLTQDLFILGAYCAVVAATRLRWLWLGVAMCALGIVSAIVHPTTTVHAFVIIATLLSVVCGFSLRRESATRDAA